MARVENTVQVDEEVQVQEDPGSSFWHCLKSTEIFK